MQYLPHWRRTIIAVVMIHALAMSVFSMLWDSSTEKQEEEPLEAVEWVDADVLEEPADLVEEQQPEVPQNNEPAPVSEFPPLIIPPLPEIPTYTEPTPQPLVETPPKPEIKPQIVAKNDIEENLGKEKVDKNDEDVHKKVKVISKVYPKDIIKELLELRIISRPEKIQSGTVLVQVVIGVDGRVKKAEIKRGGGYDERGNIINTLIEMAASRWVFEPYLDDDNKPKEMPTQIEFKPEDF